MTITKGVYGAIKSLMVSTGIDTLVENTFNAKQQIF